MISHRQQVEGAIQAATIRQPFSFTWFGQPAPVPPENIRGLMDPSAVRQHLQRTLTQRLYSDFYLSGRAMARRRERTALPVPDTHAFIAGLDAANTGSGTWSSGWTELAQSETKVVLHDDRLDLAVWLDEDDVCAIDTHDVAIRLPAALPNWSPGFWLALGDAPFADHTEQRVRFYWNLLPDGAALLVEHLTRCLNDAAIPFHLKLLVDPASYTRCDAGILYLPESATGRAQQVIQAIHERVQPRLKPVIPALTTWLGRGLARANDPGGDESFGTRCCRVLVDAMIAADDAGITRDSARLDMALSYLAAHGIALDELPKHRQPDDRSKPWSPAQPDAIPRRLTRDDVIGVATGIATHITNDAIWSGSSCTWLGVTGEYANGQPVYGTLGPDLYGGTAGIALFLGDIYLTTGDVACGTTARAAIQHALANVEFDPTGSRLGLHTGISGIVFAATRLSRTLHEPDLLTSARKLLHTIDMSGNREHDLLSGTAGTIIAALLLHRTSPDDRTMDLAVRLGDRLLDTAHRGANGYSWRSGRRALTGLSHGASGIGVAFLELADVTGESRFHAAGRAALEWERHLFNTTERNWPDLRRVSGRVRRSATLPSGVSWCHGAPGIALARMRAAELLGDGIVKAEARTALATTRDWVEEALDNGDESFCLCHGLAGNADILLDGYAMFGDSAFLDAAHTVALAGIERYTHDPLAWPSGTYHGPTPGLMLGLAGIGSFYLRLANPRLPSILLPVEA